LYLARFNGEYYSVWKFQFKLFAKGKELWGHIEGKLPTPTSAVDLAKWETKDAQIMTWILSFVKRHFIINMWPYKTTKDMWDYLKNIYHLEGLNWSMRWLISQKGVYQFKNIFLLFKIFGMNISMLFMMVFLVQPFLLFKLCTRLAKEINF